MANGFDRVVSSVIGVSAAAMAAALVYKTFVADSAGSSARGSEPAPRYVENWSELTDLAIPLSGTRGKVVLMEFADFECPSCRQFHPVLRNLMARHANDLTVMFFHWPLSYHRFAAPAARAAECAHEQNGFLAFTDLLYAKQDSLGLKSWVDYAKEAKVGDVALFAQCVSQTTPVRRVLEGIDLAERLDLKGTPSVIVNGWILGRPPSESELEAMIERIIRDGSPFPRPRGGE